MDIAGRSQWRTLGGSRAWPGTPSSHCGSARDRSHCRALAAGRTTVRACMCASFLETDYLRCCMCYPLYATRHGSQSCYRCNLALDRLAYRHRHQMSVLRKNRMRSIAGLFALNLPFRPRRILRFAPINSQIHSQKRLWHTEDASAERAGLHADVGLTSGTAAETSLHSRHGGETVDRRHAGALMMIQSQTNPSQRTYKDGLNTEGRGAADAGQLSPGEFVHSNLLRSGQRPHLSPQHPRVLHGFGPEDDSSEAFGGAWRSFSSSTSTIHPAADRDTATGAGNMLETMTVTATTLDPHTTFDPRTGQEGGRVLPAARDQYRPVQLSGCDDSIPMARFGTGEERGCGSCDARLSPRHGADVQGRLSLPDSTYQQHPQSHMSFQPPHQDHQRPRVLTKRSRSHSTTRSRPSWGSRMGSTSTSGSSASQTSHTSHTTATSISSNPWPSSLISATSDPQMACPELSSGCASCASSPESSFSSACTPSRTQGFFADLDMPRRYVHASLHFPHADGQSSILITITAVSNH